VAAATTRRRFGRHCRRCVLQCLLGLAGAATTVCLPVWSMRVGSRLVRKPRPSRAAACDGCADAIVLRAPGARWALDGDVTRPSGSVVRFGERSHPPIAYVASLEVLIGERAADSDSVSCKEQRSLVVPGGCAGIQTGKKEPTAKDAKRWSVRLECAVLVGDRCLCVGVCRPLSDARGLARGLESMPVIALV